MISKPPLRIALTGAAGQIGYALLFRLASGEVFGKDQPLRLSLIEVEPAMQALEGVAMELEDGAFPLLDRVEVSSDVSRGFEGVAWALLVGSVPRGAGMQRSELLAVNGKIFVEQGAVLEACADEAVRVVVVGNPCNTNCLLAMRSAPSIPRDRWHAMTRLDENRAKSQLAVKAGVPVSAVRRLCVWGNHSSTMFPDFYHACIGGRSAVEVIGDERWLKESFVPSVAERGTAIIKARKASSAASAAHALVQTIQTLCGLEEDCGWEEEDFHSVGVCSRGEYGTPEGIITSLPVRWHEGRVRVVESLDLPAYAREKIAISNRELLDEASQVGA